MIIKMNQRKYIYQEKKCTEEKTLKTGVISCWKFSFENFICNIFSNITNYSFLIHLYIYNRVKKELFPAKEFPQSYINAIVQY